MPQIAGILPALTSVANIGSTGYNLYNQYQQQQYQNKLRSLAENPQKMSAYAAQFTNPLNAGLQSGVANQTQAYLAERGLSDSPQISEQVEAQAIAPYIQQNQQLGYQDALQSLGLGGGAINPATQQATSANSLAKLLSSLKLGGGSGVNPVIFNDLMSSGTVQPESIDMSNFYVPDYSVGMQ